MSKFIRAINVIISNPKKITNAISKERNNEYYFLYDGKHKWSVRKDDEDEYFVYYYRSKRTLQDFANLDAQGWTNAHGEYITYSSKELKTRESLESMQELLHIVKEKTLGMGDVLDDIIASDENMPF